MIHQHHSYQVNVAEFVEPKAVDGGRDGGEVVRAEPVLCGLDGRAEAAEYPAVHRAGVGGHLGVRHPKLGLKPFEMRHGELDGVPQLVAEEPVALDAEDVQVDVLCWGRGRRKNSK